MQAFHSLNVEWSDGRSILIESSVGREGEVVPDAPPIPLATRVICTDEGSPDSVWQSTGIPALCWREESDRLFEPIQLRENTEYLTDIRLPISLDHAFEQSETSPTWPLSERLQGVFRRDPRRRWRGDASHAMITGRLNFGSYIGIANLSVDAKVPFSVEVVCTKIGYFAELRSLLTLIARQVMDLLVEVESSTALRFQGSNEYVASPLALLFHLRRIMTEDSLGMAVEAILQNPHSAIVSEQSMVLPHLAESISPSAIVRDMYRLELGSGGPLADLFSGYTPRRVPQVSKAESLDTPENRYVRAFLEDLQERMVLLHRALVRAGYALSSREVAEWIERLGDWLSRPQWRDVKPLTHMPSNSQVLQKRVGYREVLETDLNLQAALRLPWERGLKLATGIDGDMRPIFELYEYWCFFTLRDILRSLCGADRIEESSLFRFSEGGLQINLRKGRQATLVFAPPDADTWARVRLFYNRTFPGGGTISSWSGSYSVAFRPDFSILVEVRDGRERTVKHHWLHFDAKYRREYVTWDAATPQILLETEDDLVEHYIADDDDGETKQSYKVADLYKMHTYRDGLLGSRGAYVLYPGVSIQEEVYIRSPGADYSSTEPKFPSVGVFALKPDGNQGQVERLRSFLSSVLGELVYKERPYKEEYGFFPDVKSEPSPRAPSNES